VGAGDKAEIIELVGRSGLPCSRALAQLRLPRSTYYRWLKRLSESRLEDRKGGSRIPWNKLRPDEESRVSKTAIYDPHVTTVFDPPG
jgi:transposase-like protein